MPAGLSCPSPCAKRWLGCPWLHGPRSPRYAPGTGSGASGTHVHPSPWSVSHGPVADASPGPLPPGPGGRTPGGQTFGSSPPIGSHDGLGARLSNCDQVLTASGYRLVTATWHVAPRAATWAWIGAQFPFLPEGSESLLLSLPERTVLCVSQIHPMLIFVSNRRLSSLILLFNFHLEIGRKPLEEGCSGPCNSCLTNRGRGGEAMHGGRLKCQNRSWKALVRATVNDIFHRVHALAGDLIN